MVMKLGVDACLMADHPRGMGQYARTLVEPVSTACLGLLPNHMSMSTLPYMNKGIGIGPVWEQFFWPLMAESSQVTHLLSPYNTAPLLGLKKITKILVVHDLIFMKSFSELGRSPSLYQNFGRLYRRVVVPRAAKNADVLITVSEFSKKEIVEKLKIGSDRVHVIPNSLGEVWFETEGGFVGFDERKPYILTVSGEAPSKNLKGLLEAFSYFVNCSGDVATELRIVGVRAPVRSGLWEHANRLGISRKVRFEGFLEERDLAKLYREARAFVFPSLYEGFGIPLLEAMASGTPVICSNASAMPEVVGDAALLIDPRNPGDIAKRISELLSDRDKWLDFAKKGVERVKGYRREAVRRKIVHFWEQLL